MNIQQMRKSESVKGVSRWRSARLVVYLLLVMASLLLAACGSPAATPTPTATPILQFAKPFPMTIDVNKTYTATLRTSKGDIVVELNARKAPITVNNFVNLARKGFYNNTTFHRVLQGFMAQGGDPTGTGAGGPGYTIPDEFTDLRHDTVGTFSMANTGAPNSGGSQFFITYEPTPWLDSLNADGTKKACGTPGVSCHVVFGKVVKGMNIAALLTPRDPTTGPQYKGDLLLEVIITEQ